MMGVFGELSATFLMVKFGCHCTCTKEFFFSDVPLIYDHCICAFRKITFEESSRISIENQLQSEQAKASTAVVDADKYRYLHLCLSCYSFSPLRKFE